MGAIRRSESAVLFHQEGVAHIRRTTSGDIAVEFGQVDGEMDPTPFFRGLPDDRCQCRHQGYVIRGRFTFATADGPVHIDAGEAFDIPPGHVPLAQPGCEWVMFSLASDQAKTDEVIRRNVAAATGSR